jgi:LacI family transcriptional regulator
MNLTEFSRRIGLSISTVSRALNGYADVSPETRAKVVAAARELNYIPNVASRRLRRKPSLETIGFVAPRHDREFLNPVLLETLTGLDTVLSETGHNLNVLSFHQGEDEVAALKRIIAGGSVDAIVLCRTMRQDKRIHLLQEMNFPFVAFGRTDAEEPYRYVEVDHYSAAYKSVHHLVERGYGDIALLNGSEEFMLHWRRHLGFEHAMDECGLKPNPDWMLQLESTNGLDELLRDMLAAPARPNAFVCSSDHVAMSIYKVASELGLTIGADIAVIGCDDLPASAFLTPPLTSTTGDRLGAGEAIAKLLIDQQGEVDQCKSFEMQLVERASVGRHREDKR